MNDEAKTYAALLEEMTMLRQRNAELEAQAAEYHQAEARFRLLVENSTDLICCHTPDGVYLYASPACRPLLGYDPEDLVGHSAYEFFHPEDRAAIAASHATILEQPTVSTTSYRIRRKDGTYIWFETTSHAIRVEQTDEIVEIHTVSRDITARKLMEAALRESEKKYRNVIENIQDVFYRSDLKGRLLMGSSSGARMFGYDSIEEMIGMPLDSFWPYPQERQQLLAQIKATGSVKDYETILIRKDGSTFNAAFTIHFYYDDQGNLLGTEGIIRDITERKRIEEALRESEVRYRAIIESQVDLISRYLPDTTLTFVNDAYCQFYGKTRAELIGQSYLFMIAPEFRDLVRQETENVARNPGQIVGEYLNYRYDGKKCWIQWVVHCIRDDHGRVVELQAVGRDITDRKLAEEALRKSEERLRSLVETTSDWVWETDPSGVYTYVSPKVSELLGYEPEEVIGKTPFGMMSPEEAQRIGALFQDIMTNQRPIERLENTVYHKDGRLVVLETNAEPFFDTDGRLLGYRGIDRDITERKRIEEALEKRLVALTRPLETADGIEFEDLFNLAEIQHLQDLYAKAFGVAALITRPDGTPITQPSNFTMLCGEIIRKTSKGVENCHHSDAMIGRYNPSGPNIQTCLSAGLCNAGASISVGGRHIANWLIGQVRNETQNEEEIMQYAREIGADETVFRAAYRKVPIMSQEQFERVAQLLFVLANQLSTSAYQNVQQARFIAERKRAEQALQSKTEELDRYFTASLDLLCIADTDGYFRRLNPEWETTLGYTIAELEGRQFLEFVHPEDIDATVAAISQLKTQHQILNFENRYRCKDGSYRWIEWRSYPAGKRIYAVARDITERKQVEKAIRTLNAELEQRVHVRTAKLEAANKELQGFAYVVSHDLKAPLRAISRLAQWLVEDYAAVFDAKGKEMVELLIGRVKRMDELIDGVLEYSRIGHITRQAETIDLNQALPDIIHSLSPPPNLRIIIASALPVIFGDIVRIQQVFTNLIGNAMKFMDKPQGIITIRCEEAGADWRFSVTDNGPGIDPKYHKKIFQIFQTLKPRDEVESTGVGLAIVKKIVEFYGGKIWVESEAGNGSTFLFTFPKQGIRQ